MNIDFFAIWRKFGNLSNKHVLNRKLNPAKIPCIISRDRKLCYVGNAKAGNTTLCNLIFFYDHGYRYPYGDIFKSKAGFHWITLEKACMDKSILTFTFVRNPFQRAVSCFFSKANSTEDGQYFFLRDKLTSNWGFNPSDSEKNKFKIFLKFVRYQHRHRPRNGINQHWETQTRNIGFGKFDGVRIEKLEEYSEEIVDILRSVDAGADVIEEAHRKYNVTESSQMNINVLYDEESIKIVKAVYRDDFVNFGYEMTLPPADGSADQSH
jgi:hypothetical protein